MKFTLRNDDNTKTKVNVIAMDGLTKILIHQINPYKEIAILYNPEININLNFIVVTGYVIVDEGNRLYALKSFVLEK